MKKAKNIKNFNINLKYILSLIFIISSKSLAMTLEEAGKLEEAVLSNNINWIRNNIENYYADITEPNKNWMTPMDLAVTLNRLEIVKIFVQTNRIGALAKNFTEVTPIEIAQNSNFSELANYLRQQEKIKKEAIAKKVANIKNYGDMCALVFYRNKSKK